MVRPLNRLIARGKPKAATAGISQVSSWPRAKPTNATAPRPMMKKAENCRKAKRPVKPINKPPSATYQVVNAAINPMTNPIGASITFSSRRV